MNIDLEGELSRLARSVHDDGTGDRMSGQVRHMVGRIKRRRAARHTAQGAVGVGAVAAIAFGGMQLTPPPWATPPAGPTTTPTQTPTQGPTPTPNEDVFGRCGSTVEPPNGGRDPGVELLGDVTDVNATGQEPAAFLTGSLTGSIDALGPEQEIRTVVAQDGVVVGNLGSLDGFWDEDGTTVYSFAQPLVSCEDSTPLPVGAYEIYAHLDGPGDDGSVSEALFGPWIVEFAPEGGEDEDFTSEEHDGLVTLNEMVSFPAENPDSVFPLCGTSADEALDDGMPALELDLVEPELTLQAGEVYEGSVQLKTTLGRYVIGNASPTATLVVLRDSIVVGYQWLDPEGLTDVDLADGQTQDFPVLGTMTICGTGDNGTGPLLALPPGEYRVMAALDLMLKEVGEPGGEAESITEPMTAVSEAGYLTVTRKP